MSVFIAFLIDYYLGEPPSFVHPVGAIGGYLGFWGRRFCVNCRVSAFLLGLLAWLLGAIVFVGLYAWLAFSLLPHLRPWETLLVQALLLKPLFSLRLLVSEVEGVGTSLESGLTQGRERLTRIVSRDTSVLSEGEVRESALESLSENLSDSLVAPLFWFLLFGLPGAALYRFSNTADAMWGYRGKWEWAGKWAALFDDVMSYIPARLTALLLGVVALRWRPLFWKRLRLEAVKTPSPNSGWPMSAMALALGLRLGKPGVYVLNPVGGVPGRHAFQQALSLVEMAALSCVIVFSLLELFWPSPLL